MYSSYFMKQTKLKMASYPFDWIFSNINMIIDCIENNFDKFLDKKYYKKIKNSPACSHLIYGKSMFQHYNPLIIQNYEYYIRCVNRFRELLLNPHNKLFIMIKVNNINNDNFDDEILNIYKLDEIFNKNTKNYKIIYINHFFDKNPVSHEIKKLNNNIDLINLFTLSKSNGKKFINDIDNKFLEKIIFDNYKFNLYQINNNDNNISI